MIGISRKKLLFLSGLVMLLAGVFTTIIYVGSIGKPVNMNLVWTGLIMMGLGVVSLVLSID